MPGEVNGCTKRKLSTVCTVAGQRRVPVDKSEGIHADTEGCSEQTLTHRESNDSTFD